MNGEDLFITMVNLLAVGLPAALVVLLVLRQTGLLRRFRKWRLLRQRQHRQANTGEIFTDPWPYRCSVAHCGYYGRTLRELRDHILEQHREDYAPYDGPPPSGVYVDPDSIDSIPHLL